MLKNQRVNRVIQGCAILLCILSLAAVGWGQKKKPVRKAAPKPAAKPAVNTMAVREESEKVATQIKDITKFLYLLGGTNQLITGIDTDPKASANAKNTSRQAKATVLQTVKNVRAGIVQLEGEFHSKPELRAYISFIQGVSEMAGIAEDQAAAGQIAASGKTLLGVVGRLTDTLQNLH